MRAIPILMFMCIAATGCTYVNQRLNPISTPVEDRTLNQTRAGLDAAVAPVVPTSGDLNDLAIMPANHPGAPIPGPDPNADGFFVGLALSGGGSRSANFSAACMFQLQRLGLLQRVDYISSVSGGSLAAAYYCTATDAQWNIANVQRKLAHNFATDLIVQTLLPWNLFWVGVSDWDRSDILANSFRDHLFWRDERELTFADLRPDRPRLLINATNLQSGKSFIFCNEIFDQINSDLSRYPLAHAVAASSAVPVLLHQVTLRDFSTEYKEYRHLIDGGVVDNLGVKALVATYRAQLKESHDTAYPRGAVFIVVDAKTTYDAKISSRGDTSLLETLQFGAGITSAVLLNRASSATLAEMILDSAPDNITAEQLRRERDQLLHQGYVHIKDIDGRPVHVLHLALSRLNDLPGVPFKSFSQSLNNISTYFNISDSDAFQLYQAADVLVHQRFPQQLKAIVTDLNSPTTQP